jgi:chemotaxis methyl-accepting protein methylase
MNGPLDRAPAEAFGTFPGDAEQMPDPAVSPVIQRLYRRVEQTLGIRAAADALEKLREYLEDQYGTSCFDSPGFYDQILAFPEEIFTAARLLTINETYFFREEAYFDLMRREFLPRFARLSRPLRICSAATSIGCEAYSLAMVIEDYKRRVQPLSYGIDAFDINPEAIATAKQGRYTGNSLRDDGSRWKFLLDSFTQVEGQDLVIDPAIRKHVRFFTHNLLAGLMGNRYDLIFFRNALIYFSMDKRRVILDYLADALFEGGFLVLGVSEIPAVSHPRLLSQHSTGTFYFRKAPEAAEPDPAGLGPPPALPPVRPETPPSPVLDIPAPAAGETPAESPGPGPVPGTNPGGRDPGQKAERSPGGRGKARISPENTGGIAALMDDHEGGRPIEKKVPELLQGAAAGAEALSGDDLFAAVIYLLGQEAFSQADTLLSFIERHRNSACTCFLRGEYFYFNNRKKDAELSYKEAAGKDGAFWPALYRLSVLAAEGNPVQYAYKTRKALESINQGKDKGYEIFIGGFSPDYYRRALEKRLG